MKNESFTIKSYKVTVFICEKTTLEVTLYAPSIHELTTFISNYWGNTVRFTFEETIDF